MNLQKTKELVLKDLYELYKENPGGMKDVSDIIREQGEEPIEIGQYLGSSNLVRNGRIISGTRFIAQITLDGIEEINPGYKNEMKEKVISSLGLLGGRENLMVILDFEPKDNQKARDIASYLEDIRMIKKPLYTLNEIVVELSIHGREYYEENKLFFF